MNSPIRFSPSSLKEGRWYEYVVRFALGGAATVVHRHHQQSLRRLGRRPLLGVAGDLLRQRHAH